MLNLNPLICTEINEYDSICNSKRGVRKNILTNLRARIFIDYNTYNTTFNLILNRPASTYINGTEKADLQHCYSSSTAALENLLVRIEKAQKVELQHICGYCLYNKIEETDHYIPKEEYSEFSVLASNLVPVCSVCNKAKHENWRTITSSHRTFLHLYKDIIPNIQFLFGSLNYVNNLPQFTWRIDNINNLIPTPLFLTIEDHFNKLHLPDRYTKACNELLGEIELTVRTQRRLDPNVHINKIVDLLK